MNEPKQREKKWYLVDKSRATTFVKIDIIEDPALPKGVWKMVTKNGDVFYSEGTN